MRRYTIGTGYYGGPSPQHSWGLTAKAKVEFFATWLKNTLKFAQPEQIVVVDATADEGERPLIDSLVTPEHTGLVQWIRLKANLGHCLNQDKEAQPARLSGAALAITTSALVAYANKTDFIYKEQDCLAFNDWVTPLITEPTRQMLIGRETQFGLQVESCLFWIKWEFIPAVVGAYLAIPNPDGGPNAMRMESKFHYLMQHSNEKIGFFDFGYGRARPVAWPKSDPFYIQQVTENELRALVSP